MIGFILLQNIMALGPHYTPPAAFMKTILFFFFFFLQNPADKQGYKQIFLSAPVKYTVHIIQPWWKYSYTYTLTLTHLMIIINSSKVWGRPIHRWQPSEANIDMTSTNSWVQNSNRRQLLALCRGSFACQNKFSSFIVTSRPLASAEKHTVNKVWKTTHQTGQQTWNSA